MRLGGIGSIFYRKKVGWGVEDFWVRGDENRI